MFTALVLGSVWICEVFVLICGGYLVWNAATASFCQLGLFRIRSSVHIQIRFSNNLSSYFFFFFFPVVFLPCFWGWGFLSLLVIIACGVHSVLLVGENSRKRWSCHRRDSSVEDVAVSIRSLLLLFLFYPWTLTFWGSSALKQQIFESLWSRFQSVSP